MDFVHVAGREIVDGSGRPLLLRGVGLGNWLLPEGYMWRFGDGLAAPRQIEARIERLVGADAAADFWTRFRDTFVAENDIARIAALGFDHVRLPINSRIVLTDDGDFRADGFALIDRLVDWCRRHRLWVVLDLHGAPGGQTGTNIDDSPNGKPELFLSPRYRQLTVALWRKIARRYRDEPTVLAYDLLNEPLPEQWQPLYSDDLIALYEDLTAVIRAEDPHHLIMYEGPQWATDVSVFTRVLDRNSVVQFHRYWCAPERASIGAYLDLRDRLGVPVYMGEGGENTAEWIYAATRLYEQHGIGWNFWPWKKLDTRTSPVSAPAPDGWERIADPADDVDAPTARKLLDAMLDNVALDHCVQQDEVVNALFGRAPLRLPAWGHAEQDPIAPSRFTGRTPQQWEAIWHRTAGEPYPGSMAVAATAGQEFRFPLAEPPGGWTVLAPDPAAFDVHWADGALVVRATADAAWHGVDLAG